MSVTITNSKVNYGPKLTVDGLILYLDAANTDCFISGNTTCNNLTTNGLVTGANGTPGSGAHTPNPDYFPTYSSSYGGVFNFSGGKGMNCDENLGLRTTTSLCMWVYKNSSETQYFTDARNNGGQWFLSNYTEYNITYTNILVYNYGGTYNASNSDFLNKWIFVVVTSDNTGSNLYLDSELIVGGSPSVDEDFGINFRIGTRYTTSGAWTGYMGPIYAYDRVLDLSEIKQNFNSQKSRFGL